MAKLFLFLLGLLVVLNGMTFLVVVNQGGPSGNRSEANAASEVSRGPSASDQQVQRIETLLKNVNSSVTDLGRKVEDVQRKVAAAARNPAPVLQPAASAFQPAGTALKAVAPRSSRQPSAVRKAPTDMSALPRAGTARPVAPQDDFEEEEAQETDAAAGALHPADPEANGFDAGTAEGLPGDAEGEAGDAGQDGSDPSGADGAEAVPGEPTENE
ncbi:MAG TPA: hypothetical protein VMT52_06590 [Planctomycetota bacterium]|nr:hypothetical protein [Planctomycetota bacterium]